MSSPSHRPIFYDEQRKRWPWVVRLAAVALLIVSCALVCFVVSIWAAPLLPRNVLPKQKELRDFGNPDPKLDMQRAGRDFAARRDKRKLERQIALDKAREQSRIQPVPEPVYRPPLGPPAPPELTHPIVAAFYVNWEETSRASLRRHIGEITHLFPEWLHLNKDGTRFLDARDNIDRTDIGPYVKAHHVPIIPVLNNYVPESPGSENAAWSANAVHGLVSNPAARAKFIHNLKVVLLNNGWQGINIDFEQVAAADRNYLTEFMKELHNAFRPRGLLVTQDIEMDSDALDLERLALWNDYLIPMMYDEHSPGDEAGPGSIAGVGWTKEQLQSLFAKVPPSKVIVGMGGYAYDWKKGVWQSAAQLSYQSAVIQAKENQDPGDPNEGRVQIDPVSLNPYYTYHDDNGAEHVVWMLDATTAFNQWMVARPYAPQGYALWVLGTEDPSLWSVLGRTHISGDIGADVDQGALDKLTYGRQSEVDFEGEGELLEVLAEPNDGERTVKRDPRTGLITAETYQQYPSAYVVRRYGYQPKKVVLTFDDGPDPNWTPQILDILKREGVHATFFVIGKNAQENPGLVAREWNEGNEIGNHTFTHPNLATTRRERTVLEISTTQRVIEAITGHTTTLFRPPYAIDVEPQTGGELRPIILASQFHFISVGEMNDPQDWNLLKKGPRGQMVPRTADDIVNSVVSNRDAGSVVLLHDGGGDRANTVAALPRIIEELKARGYRFITVADLRGMSREAMFPQISGRDDPLVGIDKWVFLAWYAIALTLVTLFTLSVILGVSRQVFITGLALAQRRRERVRDSLTPLSSTWEREAPAEHPDSPSPVLGRMRGGMRAHYAPWVVSVVIAAYNEEKVIERTVSAILRSQYQDLEVIVVDDGSQDATYAVVSTAFAGEPRVHAIRKENGGKASALNLGMAHATGEVIVALDADTLFAEDAIPRLVRHFQDHRVGAVSGNVRVGNIHNLFTRWQALEYITSQNFERRAHDLLNCITVVPGAIGAWRLEAIRQVGGYSSDTLAEDTDLTWKIRRAGWRILNDSSALAYTEAPDTLRNLSRQRFRWAFGTLQNLVKHRDALFRHGAFGWIALPSLWLYQILFPAISPIMDIAVVWALAAGNVGQVLPYYLLMVGVEFLGAAIALWLDRGRWSLLPWLFFQRFLYRQLMYYVILKSLVAAVRGGAVGWNKFERRGTAQLEPSAPARMPTPESRPVGEPARTTKPKSAV